MATYTTPEEGSLKVKILSGINDDFIFILDIFKQNTEINGRLKSNNHKFKFKKEK